MRIEEHFRRIERDGRLHRSAELFEYARNQALLGDAAGALDLLEQAADAGWRGYHAIRSDPRWAPLREEPRFQGVLERIKADIDAQRAQVEAIDAEDDFIAQFDAVLRNPAAIRDP